MKNVCSDVAKLGLTREYYRPEDRAEGESVSANDGNGAGNESRRQ
jgi:hypothetical protein